MESMEWVIAEVFEGEEGGRDVKYTFPCGTFCLIYMI